MIIFFILVTLICDSGVIQQGEIRCLSLLGCNGLKTDAGQSQSKPRVSTEGQSGFRSIFGQFCRGVKSAHVHERRIEVNSDRIALQDASLPVGRFRASRGELAVGSGIHYQHCTPHRPLPSSPR